MIITGKHVQWIVCYYIATHIFSIDLLPISNILGIDNVFFIQCTRVLFWNSKYRYVLDFRVQIKAVGDLLESDFYNNSDLVKSWVEPPGLMIDDSQQVSQADKQTRSVTGK